MTLTFKNLANLRRCWTDLSEKLQKEALTFLSDREDAFCPPAFNGDVVRIDRPPEWRAKNRKYAGRKFGGSPALYFMTKEVENSFHFAYHDTGMISADRIAKSGFSRQIWTYHDQLYFIRQTDYHDMYARNAVSSSIPSLLHLFFIENSDEDLEKMVESDTFLDERFNLCYEHYIEGAGSRYAVHGVDVKELFEEYGFGRTLELLVPKDKCWIENAELKFEGSKETADWVVFIGEPYYPFQLTRLFFEGRFSFDDFDSYESARKAAESACDVLYDGWREKMADARSRLKASSSSEEANKIFDNELFFWHRLLPQKSDYDKYLNSYNFNFTSLKDCVKSYLNGDHNMLFYDIKEKKVLKVLATYSL